jgi:hypothetical protein
MAGVDIDDVEARTARAAPRPGANGGIPVIPQSVFDIR